MGAGFGIGALEDLGDEDEDVYDQGCNISISILALLFYLVPRFTQLW